MANPQTLRSLEGLGFAESLRWRGEELWFSDMFRGQVIAWNPNLGATVKLTQSQGGPEMPGGLGWTPDGDLLVVDCLKRQILKLATKGELSVFADLSGFTEHPLNDMHVDTQPLPVLCFQTGANDKAVCWLLLKLLQTESAL